MQKMLLLLVSAFILHPVNAQYEEKDFVHYTVRDGLSENYITCLQQDARGYMWIGTDIGLNRFDGHEFKNYFQGTKTLPLLSGTITKLKSFGAQIAIVNRGGLQLLDTRDMSLKNYVVPDTTPFSIYRNAAWDAVELPGKAYGITTASGFYAFNSAGNLVFSHDAYQQKDIGQKRIHYGRDIFRLNEKEYLAFVNGEGLAYYNAEKKRFHEISKEEEAWTIFYQAALRDKLGSTSRFQLSPDEFLFMQFGQKTLLYYNRLTGRQVISTLELPTIEFSWESRITLLNDSCFLVNGGYSGFYLFHFNRATGKVTGNSKKILSGHKIQCLYLDKDNRLWVGTAKGLLQQKLAGPVIKSYSYEPLASDSFTGGLSCAFRHRDKLYVGRFSLYKGLLIVDTASGKVIRQIEFYGTNTPWNEISSIEMYHPDTLWIGTNAGLLWFDTRSYRYGELADEKKYSAMRAINLLAPPGNDGYAWMCGVLNGIVGRYHIASRTFTFYTSRTKPALPFDNVKSIVYDGYGDVWIGGHSLARWNNQTRQFDTLISVYSGPNKYEDNILAISADKQGSLWLHNAFNGLLEYRIKEKKFVSYTMKDGLPSDVFYGFSPVINNQLWMAGHTQLTGFNTVTKKVIVYDYLDGLPEDKPSSRQLYYDSSRELLYLFNQYQLSTLSLPQRPARDFSHELLIEELTVNNHLHFFYPLTGMSFKPGQNNFSLHFGIINFESGNSYQFAYKLNETETWTDLGGQRNINLTGLSPGRYTIWLKGTGKAGMQRINKFSFVIAPPFWQTGWFLVACCGLLVGLTYLFSRFRIRQIRQHASIDKQLLQAEMKALHAQMNPHFIFNSLNSIREMILSNERKEASHFLGKFAQLIRMTLDQSGQSFISLRTTMEYLTRYIEMEQIRNSHFTCRILADDELDPDETVLPPLLIQPFVENAIWHGVTGKQKSININIDFRKQDNQLVCIIEDNGIGINASIENKKKNSGEMHQSVGIENIHNRIRLLNEKYKLQGSVSIQDKEGLPGYAGTGTVVTLTIPLEIKE